MEDHKVNALTVDVEDAVNQAMRNFFESEMPPTERVYENTMRLLDLFSEYNTLSTFFVLGEVSSAYPELVREIARRGHEIGIHGYSHSRYNSLSVEMAREEIIRSKKIIEDITGSEVIGHRAPEFSINVNTVWVLELLLDSGIKYDSSIFPMQTRRYGWSDFNKRIDWLKLDSGRKIIEAPLSSVTYFGKDFAACGGGYLRAFPYSFTDHAFKKIMGERPVIVYLHPYEIDPPPFQQFYMDKIRRSSIKNRLQLRSYWYNRRSVIPKLRKLLSTYKFSTMRNVICQELNTDI